MFITFLIHTVYRLVVKIPNNSGLAVQLLLNYCYASIISQIPNWFHCANILTSHGCKSNGIKTFNFPCGSPPFVFLSGVEK